MYQSQLEGLEVRCNLVLRALRFFYLCAAYALSHWQEVSTNRSKKENDNGRF